MEEIADGVERGSDQDGEEELSTAQGEGSTVSRARIEALVNAISQYQDVYPVVQRGVQFLCQELCDGGAHDEEITRTIQTFIETEALTDTVNAMATNLDSPAFISSCFELLVALVNKADELMAGALWKTEILTILDKIVHSVMYQNEPACVQLGVTLLSKLVGNLESIGNRLWMQLVSTTAQAMLTNSMDDGLQLECLLNLKLLFQLKMDTAVPATTANIILKTLDHINRQPAEISRSFASALVVVIFRIFDTSPRIMPHLGFSAPILAAGLHHYQLTMDLDEIHKFYVEKLIQQPLQLAVHDSLMRLIELASPPDELSSEAWLVMFQSAIMKLLLGVVWREEARAFLDSGGVAVLANVFTSGSVVSNTAMETALAQMLCYVALHWPDETWNEIQVNGTGLNKWFEVATERCKGENDSLLHYLLAMMKTLLNCEGFLEAFTRSDGVDVFLSVLHKHHLLPLCTRLVINVLMSVPDICPATSLPELCCSVAETMLALESNSSSQLECVKALKLLISQQSDNQTLLSSQHVRDIIRVMRSKLVDGPFTAEMLGLVASTLWLSAASGCPHISNIPKQRSRKSMDSCGHLNFAQKLNATENAGAAVCNHIDVTAQENLLIFNNAIALFATTSYVNRLISRLDKCVTKEGVIESDSMVEMAEDFKALEALLFSSQAKKTIDAYHRLFGYLAAIVENATTYGQALRDHAPFFMELGCLTSQLLPTVQREEVINTALCHFAEDTAWHSMGWIAALADRGSSEFTLIVEFVLLRIVSGYTILEPALLMELLDALNYLLHCSQCREIVLASSHARELQSVLWELVHADVAHMDSESNSYDIAVSLLGIISSLLSSFSGEIFSVHSKENGSGMLVRFCLGAVDNFSSEISLCLTKFALVEEVLQTTGTILQHCIPLGAEYARSIIQHRATRYAFNISVGSATAQKKTFEKWCLVVLGAVVQSHGLLYAERLLRLSSHPSELLDALAGMVATNTDMLSWKSFIDCITMVNGSSETNGWQADCSALFEKLQLQTKRLMDGPPTVVNSRRVKKHITDTIAQLSFKYGQLCTDTSRGDMDGCLQVIAQSGLTLYELFIVAPSFDALEYSAVASLHLKIARLAGFKTETERSSFEKAAISFRQLFNPICISDEALADYLDLAAVVYLSPSVRAAAWLFIDAAGITLSKSMQRLTTGLVRSQCLEKSLLNCFSSLRVVYDARWECGEVESVLELLKICSPDRWSQELLLESVLVLPQGLLHLFELARVAHSNDVQVVIMTFLFQHVNDIRHKTQRIGELELNAILSIIKRNVAGRVGDTSQRKWREVTGSEMLRSALETLKLFARRKNCAVLCSDLGGISILYNVLCAPSQYEDSIHLALEICCYLAGYGADLTHENSTFALQLLFVFVETNVDISRTRLAFLVLEYFLAVGVSALSLPLIQQCRTGIVPVSARSHEETEMFIQQLYITRQKLAPPRRTPKPPVSDPSMSTNSPAPQIPLTESEIRGIILSSCRRIVQCTNGENENSYVDVNTSEKSTIEPLEYFRLREAIDQLSFVLDDPDMAMNPSYVSALVPALSEILVLHASTTATICIVMQVLDQIAFVMPSIVLLNEQLDSPALFASCSLHQRSSLAFARHLCRFCNSIGAELRAMPEDEFGLSVSLVPLLLELLQHWKSDFEIVDQSLATLQGLIAVMRIEEFEHLHCGDILALLNTAVIPYTSNSPTSWNWLKSVLVLLSNLDKLAIESSQGMISVVIAIIHMFMSHSFMVEKALLVLIRVYQGRRQLPLRHLLESDGVEVLLTCLKLHANDQSIVQSCLNLLVNLATLSDTSPITVDQLLTAAAAAPILLVTKKNADNPLTCGMCIELVHRMVESFERRSGKKHQVTVLPGDASRKKSELLKHLLEADIIPLVFDLLDNYSSRRDNELLVSLLALLKSLTKDDRLRESAEVLHGLQELQQTIDRVRGNNFDCALVELAIDCLVNLACSDRAIGHGWRELPMWLLHLAHSIHNLEAASTGMCVEKLVGILGRLTVDSAICKIISPKGSFTILELLARVGSNYSLEQALYGLLCALCEDIACAQTLIVYDAIPITAERIICHVDDEDTLLSSLCFFDLLVLNSGESYPALQDEIVFEALDAVIETYPEITGGQFHRIASTILEKVSALDYQSTRKKAAAAKSTKLLKPAIQIPDSEKPFHDLLREGAKFRVLWEARPDTVESIQVKLAPSGDYLLFRRKASSELPRVERIFVSQLEVCPQRSLVNPASPASPSKKILAQSLLKENFEGDRVLRLKVRDEDVLIKTSSTRERVHWDQALQWLVSHRETRTSPIPHSRTFLG
ncbi:hypothetical protein PHYPSEUDO_014482 [Phytophthora pseudosyringae]|uniref:Uncharacterized protein n=1 Tax=Phytophthora pseudosyringae TaxID=221518 RepID=A0A8T1W586_9STRA|nr:hypothetical protein PHYPSEUDO_014482 [Phytophthora pseudosyringae]